MTRSPYLHKRFENFHLRRKRALWVRNIEMRKAMFLTDENIHSSFQHLANWNTNSRFANTRIAQSSMSWLELKVCQLLWQLSHKPLSARSIKDFRKETKIGQEKAFNIRFEAKLVKISILENFNFHFWFLFPVFQSLSAFVEKLNGNNDYP